MIKSKLPKKVLLHIEVQKGPDTKWSSKELRDRLRTYIVAREGLEQNDDSDEINQGATKKYHIWQACVKTDIERSLQSCSVPTAHIGGVIGNGIRK